MIRMRTTPLGLVLIFLTLTSTCINSARISFCEPASFTCFPLRSLIRTARHPYAPMGRMKCTRFTLPKLITR